MYNVCDVTVVRHSVLIIVHTLQLGPRTNRIEQRELRESREHGAGKRVSRAENRSEPNRRTNTKQVRAGGAAKQETLATHTHMPHTHKRKD